MRELLLDLASDAATGIGRRAALEQALRQAIRNGRLTSGTSLPSSRVLAADISMSRSTVVAAYEQLTAEGYLVSAAGSATRVAEYRDVGEAVDEGNPFGPNPTWDWRPGHPDVSSFPRSAWMRSLRRTMASAPDDALAYPDPRGLLELRSALTDYLARTRTVHAPASSLRIGSGITSSLRLLADTFRRLGITRVAVEDPMFFLHALQLREAGMELVSVPVDDEGICVDELAALDVRAVLVTPANQYPLGVTMSARRRSELTAWARINDCWIVEDDYDGEFRYDKRPIGSLQGLAPDRVVYCGTSSKSLAPGLRMSWLAVPDQLRAQFDGVANLLASTPALDQLTLADFITTGSLDRQIRVMRTRYQHRRNKVVDALKSTGDWLDIPTTTAGLHLTATIAASTAPTNRSSGRDIEAPVLARAEAASVGLFGLATNHWGSRGQPGFVIGFSRPVVHQFDLSLERLVAVMRD